MCGDGGGDGGGGDSFSDGPDAPAWSNLSLINGPIGAAAGAPESYDYDTHWR